MDWDGWAWAGLYWDGRAWMARFTECGYGWEFSAFNNSFTKWSGVIGVTGVLRGFSLLLIFKHDGLLQTKHTGNGSCRR